MPLVQGNQWAPRLDVAIDDETLDLVDALNRSSAGFAIRSALIREAIRAYLAHEFRRGVEARERRLFRKNKRLLDRQLKALVKEEADCPG